MKHREYTPEMAIEILGKLIDLLRSEGVNIDDPYDFENFIEDNASHSNLFKTGRFDKSNKSKDGQTKYGK